MASPDPSPRANLPGYIFSIVAAACAMMAGWYRPPMGTVTSGPTVIFFVLAAMAARTSQTKKLCWNELCQGRKWSPIQR